MLAKHIAVLITFFFAFATTLTYLQDRGMAAVICFALTVLSISVVAWEE